MNKSGNEPKYDIQKIKRGYGLTNIETRTASINGNVVIEFIPKTDLYDALEGHGLLIYPIEINETTTVLDSVTVYTSVPSKILINAEGLFSTSQESLIQLALQDNKITPKDTIFYEKRIKRIVKK